MVNFIDTIIILIICVVFWLAYSGILMVHIRLEAKKKWKENEENYPYFHYPFYKKIFLLGLKGCINRLVVISTFILNISLLILIGLSIWYLISPNIYLAYILRITVGVYGISILLKSGLHIAYPPKF